MRYLFSIIKNLNSNDKISKYYNQNILLCRHMIMNLAQATLNISNGDRLSSFDIHGAR